VTRSTSLQILEGKMKLSRILLTGSLLALLTLVATAQERTGRIEGLVTDPSGSAVPRAEVEVTGPGLPQAQRTQTDGAGAYLFPSLPPGTYTVSVKAQGFSLYKASNVLLNVGRTIRVDARLEVGAVAESVVVSGEALLVDTANTTVQTNVTAELYDRLPKGRSFDSLIVMAPGVRREPKSGGYQVDGASGSENSFVLDGIETTSIQTGELMRQSKVPIEWIAETNVKSSGFDAQYGGAIGGVVAATTRSGGNEFHGQASLYLMTDGMIGGFANPIYGAADRRPTLRLNPANDAIGEYFSNKKDGYRMLNPGFRVGGPIKKDMVWFFLSAYPEFHKADRTVTFLRPAETRSYTRKDRQDFTLAKIDVQPFSKLRTNFSYFYNPYKVNGLLPTYQGTDAITTPWADRGLRRPATGFGYQADYTVTAKLAISAFGGYQYSNYYDYGIPRGTRYRYANGNAAVPGVPANLIGPAGNFTPDNRQTVQDIFQRNTLHVIGSYLANIGGSQHNFRFGWDLNRLANKPVAGSWPDGYVFVYWDRAYSAVTKGGNFRGQYGYYINRAFATEGDVSSNNQGLFINDNWRVNKKLTLNLGLRSEREFLPSFDPKIQVTPIEFGFGSKIAPRLGFAYDPTGAGKMRFGASWGFYYDIMKYEMPRGSFGGDKWLDYVYTLDNPNILNIKPGAPAGFGQCACPGTLIEVVNWRIPSHDPSENLIEKNLKPVRSQVWDASFDYNFNTDYVFRLRYTHRHLDRTIEDVGILTPAGEQYYIANPGFGLTVDPKIFPSTFPPNVTPKAKRVYDGVEIGLERRFSKTLAFNTSYTISRLYGNYAGLANSDENGRTSPNVNRVYDEPWMAYDEKGKLVYGRLATDRPHAFKFFGSYDLKTKAGTTRFAPRFDLYSGTPITTEVNVQHVPVFVFGRGDLGRTPFFTQTDLLISHDIPVGKGEVKRIRLEMNVSNLFNHARATNRFPTLDHANDGGINFDADKLGDIFKGYNSRALMTAQKIRTDPRYGLANEYQLPRELRLGFHFFF
jgi:hypothetical protein